MNTIKKYISLGLCLIILFVGLIFTACNFSNLLQSNSTNSIVAGDILHEKPPASLPEGSSLSSSFLQPILMAGPGTEECAPSPPPEEGVS